eukprot:s274_g4.t1
MAEPVEMPEPVAVEMAGEMKKQKLKKNKMTAIPVDRPNDDFPPYASFGCNESDPSPMAADRPPISPPSAAEDADVEDAEDVEVDDDTIFDKVSSPERTEARDNRWRSKDQSNWQPTLNGPTSQWKEGARAAPAAPAVAAAPVVESRQSWPNGQVPWQSYDYRNERYSQSSSASNYRNERYSQSYSSYNSYQGQADSTSSSTWKSNNGYYSRNSWWDNRPFLSYGDEFDQSVKDGMRRFCSWLPKYMQRLRAQESRLTKRQGCLLAKELDASNNLINHTALKMLLTEERIVLGVLNLHHNRLTRPAAGMLAIWIRTAPWALYELHLSHNEIDTEGDCGMEEASGNLFQFAMATVGAFAAVLADGSVVTWGNPNYGGNSSAVRDELKNVEQVEGTFGLVGGSFAAILADKSSGDHRGGGTSRKVSNGSSRLLLPNSFVAAYGTQQYPGDLRGPRRRNFSHPSALSGAAHLLDGWSWWQQPVQDSGFGLEPTCGKLFALQMAVSKMENLFVKPPWLDAGELSHEIRNGYCEQSVGQKCPVVHLPYLTQRFRFSPEATGSWAAAEPRPKAFARPTSEASQESVSVNASKPPWVEVDHVTVPEEPQPQTWRVVTQLSSTDPPEIEESVPEETGDESPWCKGRPEEAAEAAEAAPFRVVTLSTDPPEIEETVPEEKHIFFGSRV